jgi:hypothetical protein
MSLKGENRIKEEIELKRRKRKKDEGENSCHDAFRSSYGSHEMA